MASMIRWLAIACVALAACAGSPGATECATGITCPEGTKCAAVQPVCITNDCGDGIVQSTEKCDDGNILDGDGCAANCLSREECGDGVLNSAAGEVCDDGNTVGGDGCSADCRSIEICGNGIRDINEVCDDGNTVPGDGCSGNCKSTEVCGNGIVDINEKCDDGGEPGGCNDDCQGGTGCRDGAIDKDGDGNPLEECDDGNMENQDDCTNECKLNICGDGIIQLFGVRTEDCDPAPGFGETAECNLDCTFASCGDGKINRAAGEQCDDGPGMNADDRDCTSMCKINVCGDGLANTTGPNNIEECDDGNDGQTDGCSNQCTLPDCGNGVIEMGEACDDGNLDDGDGCSSTCVFETCGDGIVNNGEACDPGPMFETDECNADCTPQDCGDGKVNVAAGEECDDGNSSNNDACLNTCKLNVCGDGFKSPTELCDDGDDDNSDGCTTSCTTPSCQNGIVDMNEQCDDGNASNNDGCLATCVYNTCGDGHRNPATEECDDGMDNDWTAECLPTCKLNVCGDGFHDAANEACDDGNEVTETECPYGVQSCTLCDDKCENTLNLTGNVCGDGVVSVGNEVCDDGNRITETACPYGQASCMDLCNDTCQASLNLTGPVCGDGNIDLAHGEGCDDGNNLACGTCDAACNMFASAPATGYIVAVPGTQINDGSTFTINDGFGTVVVFEFDDDMMSNASNTRIAYSSGDTAAQIAKAIENAIDSHVPLKISAVESGALVLLTHERNSSLGNVAITENVTGDGNNFVVAGMFGGAGGDCPIMTGCKSGDDCASGKCTSNMCVP